jgi:hypothetical protein
MASMKVLRCYLIKQMAFWKKAGNIHAALDTEKNRENYNPTARLLHLLFNQAAFGVEFSLLLIICGLNIMVFGD